MTALLRRCTRFRAGTIAAVIALAVTIVAGLFADHQNRMVSEQRARTDVGEQLGLIRAKLEGNINSNIQLVRGLAAVIESEPDMGQDHFGRIADSLIGDHSQLRNIAAARDLVIGLMYPLEGNEQAIGLDYRNHERQRDAALEAVRLEKMVLAGPVELVQGGKGFVGRIPVFLDGPGGERELWGLVSAVVDVGRLYADSGLLDPDLPIDIAIMGQSTAADDRTVFFGSKRVFGDAPVMAEVSLPAARWILAAVPKNGWAATRANAWLVRLLLVLGGALVVVPIAVAGRLYDQRQAYIQELAHQNGQMQRLSQRLKLALDTSMIGVWELNLDTGELSWDRRMKELYGLSPDAQATSVDVWAGALHPDDRERAERDFAESIADDSPYASEYRLLLPDGATRWIRAIGAVNRDADGQRYIVGVNWDVTADVDLKTHLLTANRDAEMRNRELEEARAQMEHNSLHDSLTGLPNRRYLDEKALGTGDGPIALLHIDLDRFKHINDTLGHAAGDAMLCHAATVLKANAHASDIVARIGGDEFVIATTRMADEDELSLISSRIIEQLSEPVPYDGHECRCGASIGIAVSERGGEADRKRLLIDADIALYRAKSEGRNRYEFFSESLKAEVVRNKHVADDILSGLERREFVPYFHPQFDARTLDIVGAEALARWEHPTEGILAPDAFMRTAYELNVVPLIDHVILEQALWHNTVWQAEGIAIPRLSVNVSAGRLKDAGLIDSLGDLPIQPGRISFELLESIFLDDEDEAISENIASLKEKGIDIEIDDFGTGYASIVSLINLRPSRLKIERQLIDPIITSEGQRRLVRSIVEIGHSLGIEVLAEGVETMEHVAILRDLGCDCLQGYAFGKPMTAVELARFVREERWRQAA